jgi:hypothetical protein
MSVSLGAGWLAFELCASGAKLSMSFPPTDTQKTKILESYDCNKCKNGKRSRLLEEVLECFAGCFQTGHRLRLFL